MAICGRCWICGCKFSCDETDEGAYVTVTRDHAGLTLADERREKVCTACVTAIDGDLPTGPNEPHGDGEPEIDRLADLIGMLAKVAQHRAGRATKGTEDIDLLLDHVAYCGHCSCNRSKRDRCEEYVRLRGALGGP